MKIFPAIDLYDGKAVRLFKGDYNQMTVYNESPLSQAKEFEKKGAKYLHMVDLEGAKTGETPNLQYIKEICENTGLFIEVGGGIRSMDVAEKYLSIGVDRIILGTAAVTDEKFLFKAAEKFGEKLAVGVDIKDGYVSIKGWTEKSAYTLELYKKLSEKYTMDFIASGGVSSLDDVKALSDMGIYGAIIGKAYYTGAVDLTEAVEVAK